MSIFLLLLSSIFLHLQWFFDFSPLTSGDWWFYFPETQREFLRLPHLWNSNGLGMVEFGSPMYPVFWLWGLLSQFLSFGVVERVVYFYPSLLFAVIGSYYLSRRVFNSNIAGIIGSIVYTYNTYFMLGRTGHMTLMAAFAVAPLVLYFYIRSIKEKKRIDIIITSLLASLMSFYEIRAFYIFVFVLFFYFLYRLIFIKKLNFIKFVESSIRAITPIFFVILVNIYWILGFAKINIIASNELFNRGFFGNELLSTPYALALFHPFWTGGEPSPFIIQQIPFYIWLIPVFAFLGLYLNKKNRDVVFFGFIALLGIILAKQVAQPFSGFYQFLHTYLPGFNAFREASKFYFLIALGYSVLIAGFVDWIWRNWKKKGMQTYGKYLLTVLISFIFLWNTKPLITGEIKTLFVPRVIHNDYLLVKNFILKQDDYSRTIWIPTYSRFSIYTQNHPEISAVNVFIGSWNKFSERKSNNSALEGQQIIDMLNQNIANNLLDQSSIKYVIVPLRDIANDDDFFIHYGGHPPEFYIDALDGIDYLKRVDIGTDEIVVYENADYRPHIYFTKIQEQTSKNIPYSEVRHEMVNPTEYRVRLENVSESLYLNFSESFHPQWKTRAGEFSWWDALINKDYFLPDDAHFKNDAQLNSFRIDPGQVCKVDKVCKVNSDGSFDIEATIYFRPQSYMYLGLIISGTTLAGIVSYLIITLVRRYRRKSS